MKYQAIKIAENRETKMVHYHINLIGGGFVRVAFNKNIHDKMPESEIKKMIKYEVFKNIQVEIVGGGDE